METEVLVAIVGFAGVLFGSAISIFIHWREGKDKYQQMAFEKRLQVHQEAYAWCERLFEYITPFDENAPKDKIDVTHKFDDWFYSNCLYLDKNSVFELQYLNLRVLEFFEKYGEYNMATSDDRQRAAFRNLEEALGDTKDAIARGIGVKYIPDIKRSNSNKKVS